MKKITRHLLFFALLFLFYPTTGLSDAPKRILIVGVPKTGTTLIYGSINDAMGEGTSTYFEPDTLEEVFLSEQRNSSEKILIKLLLNADIPSIEDEKYFDKKILIARDPRDVVVSALLYSLRHSQFRLEPEKLKIFMDALRQKEKDPTSISVVELFKIRMHLQRASLRQVPFNPDITRLKADAIDEGGVKKWVREVGFEASMLLAKRDYFVIRYEDFVDGKIEALEEYLGLNITLTPKEWAGLTRVARTKSYGQWKNWLTEEDVVLMREAFGSYITFFNYSNDWSLNQNPVINPEHGSRYVEKLLKERAEEEARLPILPEMP